MAAAHLQATNAIKNDYRHVVQGCVISILGHQFGKIFCREFTVFGTSTVFKLDVMMDIAHLKSTSGSGTDETCKALR